MADRLIEALKGTVELNLRYSSVVLNLAKEYVKDVERVVRQREAPPPQRPAEPPPAPPRRAPILLVGELGEVASGAFALNNTAGTDLNVTLVVQGELDPEQVELVPNTLLLPAGRNAYVRIKVPMTDAIPEDRDLVGAVLAPGLSSQAIEFVVHRLPGQRQRPTRQGRGAAGKRSPKE